MEHNERRFIRIENSDLLEVRLLDGSPAATVTARDFSPLGICFYSPLCWESGQQLVLRYAVPETTDNVEMSIVIVWSELIDDERGFLVGARISDIGDAGLEAFLRYYYKKVKDLSS
jgi:hypothetical protein